MSLWSLVLTYTLPLCLPPQCFTNFKEAFFFFFLQCATQEVGAPLTKVAVGHSEGLGTKGSRVSLMSGHPISVNTTQPKKPFLKISLL